MQQSTTSGVGCFESFGRRFDEEMKNVAPRVEEEVRRTIAYINDDVVPRVRRSASDVLRSTAEHLSRMAEHLDGGRPRDRQQEP
jgi:hypothetical protein